MSLTPQEWSDLGKAIRAAYGGSIGIGPETIMVRSHVYPPPTVDGECRWECSVEGTEHHAAGVAPSAAAAFAAIDLEIRSWYPDAGADERVNIARIKHDGQTG